MDEVGRNKLWQEYMQTGKSEIREQLIAEYAQLVKLVAGRLSMYLGYNVEYDDLVGYGIFGLIDAIDKFDYSKNVKFESYASLRIRGAILDQIRKMDWLPRSIRQKQKKIDAAMSKIETEKGHVATDEEIAEELEITVDELNSWQGQTKASNLISLDEYTETGSEAKIESVTNTHFDQPEEVLEKEELKIKLTEAINSLTEKERNVILYEDDLLLITQATGSPVRGYLMIVIKQHINGFAELSKEELKHVEKLINIIKDFYKKYFYIKKSVPKRHFKASNNTAERNIYFFL